MTLHVHGMLGLGDNIYQRAVIREVAKHRPVYLETTWPQLYADLPVRCVRAGTALRTQAKNAARQDLRWHVAPRGARRMRWHYVGRDGSILQCLSAPMSASPTVFDLPRFEAPIREPYVVVRPATLRREWRADSRNPHPGYIDRAVRALREKFRIVSVADLQGGAEWPAEPLPIADEQYHAGELRLEQLLGLVAGASAVVGGVGWLVPAAVAYRVPMLLIYGGWGRHNGPSRLFDRPMDVSRVHQALPDRFCMCATNAHGCDKRINDFDAHADRFAVRLSETRTAELAA